MGEKIYKILILVICVVIFGVLSASALVLYVSFDLPDVKKLALYTPPVHSQIYSRDGKVLLTIAKEKREMTTLKQVPKHVVNAFLASEDSNFFEHHGVDYYGILRAIWADVRAGKLVQGGSTITQQVAKSVFLSNHKSFTRKLKDMLLAQKIEQVFTKEEILNLYLNHVYFGGGYYGIKAAVHGHFDKELKDTTTAEAALLVGLLVAPSKYSPYVNTYHAKMRQKYVLGRMLETGKITRQEYELASGEEVRIHLQRGDDSVSAGHFTDWIRQRVIESLGEETLLTDGIRVTTTLDFELQQAAEKALQKGVRDLDKRQGFKGPLKSFGSDEEIQTFLLESRKRFLEKNSKFFKIAVNGDKKYEINFDDKEFLQMEKESEKAKINKDLNHFWPGIVSIQDKIQNSLKKDELYEAIVEKINDPQKVIYVSIAGAKGIIPKAYFQWAHKRKISEFSTSAYVYVNKPSDILKKGDVIQVRLIDTPKSPWDSFDEKYKKTFKNEKKDHLVSEIKKQLFYVCELEQEPEAQGALIAMKAQTGEVLAMVGGVDFDKSQFNRSIQALRQPGSSYKPIIYAAALENGYTPAHIIIDSPEALSGADDSSVWKPKNYDGEFQGAITFRRSLEQSRNVPTIKMAMDIGVKKIIDFSERVGMDASHIDKDLSLSLGSFGVTLLNLVNTYVIFPNAGKRVTPRSIISIKDRHGKHYYLDEKLSTLPREKPEEQVYDPRLAYVMTNLLRGVIQSGTAGAAKDLGPNVAGKTGTTNDYVDAWFVGFSSSVVAGVWTGFDNNETLGYGETGGKTALPIWKDFMRKVLQKYGEQEFRVPPGIINVLIDKDTGKLANEHSTTSFMETFVEGTEPGRNAFLAPPPPSTLPIVNGATNSDPSSNAPNMETNNPNGNNQPSTKTEQKSEILDDDYYLNQ